MVKTSVGVSKSSLVSSSRFSSADWLEGSKFAMTLLDSSGALSMVFVPSIALVVAPFSTSLWACFLAFCLDFFLVFF